MKWNWKTGETPYVIERGMIKQVKITAIEEEVIRVKDGYFSWGIVDESKLFRTEEEAMQHKKEKAKKWKESLDSKEKLLKELFHAAMSTHNGEEILALQDLIQKHFDVRVSYND